MKYTFASVLLISFISFAGSLPFSRSGVIDCPDAYVLQHTEIEAALSAAAYSVQDSAGTSNSEFMITGYLDVGLFRYAQIGISYLGDGGVVGAGTHAEPYAFHLRGEPRPHAHASR